LDNKALDIIDARCNHEGPGVAFSYLVSGTYSGILQPTVRWQNKVGLGTCKYTNPYFAVSQIHGGAPRIKKKKVFRVLQWMGASKLFDISNGSSCHTAKCSS